MASVSQFPEAEQRAISRLVSLATAGAREIETVMQRTPNQTAKEAA